MGKLFRSILVRESVMALPVALQNLSLPVIGSPMFIASGPALVAAQCKAGIVGAFPALNARPAELLDTWLTDLEQELGDWRAANPGAKVGPIAVNQIVHQSNDRLEHDVEVCVRHRVPIIISSLRAPPREMLDAIHSYGGIVLHDVISIRHAKKALEAGVSGPLALSGAIASGDAILAAQAMGADFAYIGSRWLATRESNVSDAYRDAIVESAASDVVYTNLFTGVHGNYLKKSILNAGLDPEALPESDKSKMSFGSGSAKAWRDIWGAGQGVGLMDDVPTVAEMVARLKAEYDAARARLGLVPLS
jgi:nitronate monooxygenase